MGLWGGWPSWALTKRSMSDTPAEWMSRNDHAWTVALFDLANVLCAWPSGLLADRIGRKGCLLVIGNLLCVSFGVLFLPSRWALFTGRTLAGIAKALALCTNPAFLAEISTDEGRGKLNVVVACFDALGMLVAMMAGPWCPYQLMNGISLGIGIAFLVAVIRVPETPSVLLSRGQTVDARKSREWYRPDDTAAHHDQQMTRLRQSVHKELSSPGTFRELFVNRSNLVALALVLGSIVAQRGGGIACVLAYSTTTLPKDGPVDPHRVAVTFAVIRLVFTVAAVPLIDQFGRRPLLIGSHLACAVVSAAYAWLLSISNPDELIGWALASSVVLFVAVYSVGAGAVPGALLGEMFSSNVKSRAVTVVNVVASLCSFITTGLYLKVTDAFGVHIMYIAFSVVNIAWAACAYIYLFETNGKSLSGIQEILHDYRRQPRDVESPSVATSSRAATPIR